MKRIVQAHRDKSGSHRRPGIPLIVAGVVVALLCAGSALATEFRGGEAVQIDRGDILDDLFIGGNDISVNAHILGDLFAAGQTVSIGDSALIENSVAAAGQRVDVNGHVINSVRAFGQDVNLRGHVERNAIVFAATTILDDNGWIEKDLGVYCGKLIVRGRIGGDLTGEMDQVVISGQIDGDVNIVAQDITVLPSAIIGGKLIYKSHQEPKIEEGAQIFEGVEAVPFEEEKGGYSFGSFLWDSWWFLAAFAVGIAMLVFFKPFMLDLRQTALDSSLVSLGLGFLFLVCLPVAAIVLAFTVLGVPLAVLVLMTWGVLLYLSKIFTALAVGDWLLGRLRGGKRTSTLISLFVGLLLLTIVTAAVALVPYLGFLTKVMIVSLGFGAFFITAYRYRTRAA